MYVPQLLLPYAYTEHSRDQQLVNNCQNSKCYFAVYMFLVTIWVLELNAGILWKHLCHNLNIIIQVTWTMMWYGVAYIPPVAAGDVQSLYPSPWVPSPFPPSPHPPSQAGYHMAPQSELSLPPTVAVPLQQRVVELERCVDTGVPAAQVGAVPPVVHGVAGCSHFDAPPQNGQWSSLGCLHVGRYWEGDCLGTPGEKRDITMYSNIY